MKKIARKTASITTGCSTTNPHRLPAARRKYSLPQKIHHSNERDQFHSSVMTFPRKKKKGWESPTGSAHAVKITTDTSGRELSPVRIVSKSSPSPCGQVQIRGLFSVEVTPLCYTVALTSRAICCGRTDGSIHIHSPGDGVRAGGGEGRKRTNVGEGNKSGFHRREDLKYLIR